MENIQKLTSIFKLAVDAIKNRNYMQATIDIIEIFSLFASFGNNTSNVNIAEYPKPTIATL